MLTTFSRVDRYYASRILFFFIWEIDLCQLPGSVVGRAYQIRTEIKALHSAETDQIVEEIGEKFRQPGGHIFG